MSAASIVRCLGIVGMLACAYPGMGRADVELVSVGVGGAPANGPSYRFGTPSTDGRFVVFTSDASNLVPRDTNDFKDVFLRDRLNHTTRLVSLGPSGVQGNAASGGGVISQDGRFGAFSATARNLVPGDTNGWPIPSQGEAALRAADPRRGPPASNLGQGNA